MADRLDDHRAYLSDDRRLAAFERAIRSVVHPDAIVADVGSGTGILALLACRAGARHVYALEPSGIVAIARDIARANGMADRITFLNATARDARLPERCDVVLSDLIGHFAYDAGLFSIAKDFSRLLTPDGTSIPASITFVVAPGECAAAAGSLRSWREPVLGFDVAPGYEAAVNTPRTEFTAPADLLSDDRLETTVDLLSAPDLVRLRGSMRMARSGVVRGLAAWFVASLADGVPMTNAPDASCRVARRNMVLPIATELPVDPGDEMEVDVAIRPLDLVVSWRVAVRGRESRQSSFRGLLLRDDRRDRP